MTLPTKISGLECVMIGGDSTYQIYECEVPVISNNRTSLRMIPRKFVVEKASGVVHPTFRSPHGAFWKKVAYYILAGGDWRLDPSRRERLRDRIPEVRVELEEETRKMMVPERVGWIRSRMKERLKERLREEGLLLPDEELPDSEIFRP